MPFFPLRYCVSLACHKTYHRKSQEKRAEYPWKIPLSCAHFQGLSDSAVRSMFLALKPAKRGRYNPKIQALLHIYRVRSDDAGRMVCHRKFGR
jgi:hypothetical protein